MWEKKAIFKVFFLPHTHNVQQSGLFIETAYIKWFPTVEVAHNVQQSGLFIETAWERKRCSGCQPTMCNGLDYSLKPRTHLATK